MLYAYCYHTPSSLGLEAPRSEKKIETPTILDQLWKGECVQWILIHLFEIHAFANWRLLKSSCWESSSLNHTCDMGVSEFRIRNTFMIFSHRYTSDVVPPYAIIVPPGAISFLPCPNLRIIRITLGRKSVKMQILRFKFAGQKDVLNNNSLQHLEKTPCHLEIQHTFPRTNSLID